MLAASTLSGKNYFNFPKSWTLSKSDARDRNVTDFNPVADSHQRTRKNSGYYRAKTEKTSFLQ
jgi:hypothetical protein